MIIKILNPLEGGATHVGDKRAQRYCKTGRAVMVGTTAMRFVEAHHGHKAAVLANAGRHTQGGYDRVRRLMTREEMIGLPIVNPREMLAPSGRLVQRPLRMSVKVVNQPYVQNVQRG